MYRAAQKLIDSDKKWKENEPNSRSEISNTENSVDHDWFWHPQRSKNLVSEVEKFSRNRGTLAKHEGITLTDPLQAVRQISAAELYHVQATPKTEKRDILNVDHVSSATETSKVDFRWPRVFLAIAEH